MTSLTDRVTDYQAAAWACEAAAGAETFVAVYAAHTSAESVARGINNGRIRAYRPAGRFEARAFPAEGGAAVWSRFTAGEALPALPETLTVRVPNYGPQKGYEGVRVVTVEISARCQVCGGPRGELRPDTFRRDGVSHVRDAWDNPCGHADEYKAVLAEARRRQEGYPTGRSRGPVLAGVEGGAYRAAVDLIAAEVASWPWVTALRVIPLLEKAGEQAAADAVTRFRAEHGSGSNTSARSAALYLMHCDEEALKAAATTTGDVK
ncbi:hypothetical protein GR925_25735 [Streptomyces sp. HUCO-GS316]|uniref:hypothetical protein n=1 Tax=Streptomyces sp. HUCO-GS316 TaxID=2692198 RepID=UPI00136E54EE|nr:hypothetical protein [Streptomyces sp. HUCO-GS316]MXM66738.1 hypothetical protein [Streptomyces sp. HUCO-GS316]